MADGDGSGAGTRAWRVTGWRRWLYLLLLALFLAQAGLRLVALLIDPPPHYGNGIALVLALLGVLAYTGLAVQHVRTQVSLEPDGIDVRVFRTRRIPYASIARVFRDRFQLGAVTLELEDQSRVVLPAPATRLKSPTPELDEAVALIQARVAAARPGYGEDAPG